MDILSFREREVFELYRKGLKHYEVAEKLFVSSRTIKFHLENIYEKLGVKSYRDFLNRMLDMSYKDIKSLHHTNTFYLSEINNIKTEIEVEKMERQKMLPVGVIGLT